MDVLWHTRGFEKFGWKVRFCMWLVRVFYRLKLISAEDVKAFSNTIINAWLTEQARKKGLRVETISLDHER